MGPRGSVWRAPDGREIATRARVSDLDIVRPEQLEGLDDICSLDSVNEGALLHTLRQRYARDMIYTCVSRMILIAANPFRNLQDEMSEQRLAEYAAADDLDSMPPHIFGLTRQALQDMRMGADMAAIISGESGSGKSETEKLIIRALTASGAGGRRSGRTGVQELLLQASPALEAFGNAATSRNPNSSRFGKWLNILLAPDREEPLRVQGCELTHYLLETTRVCAQAPGERNFHVFYQLLQGPADVLESLGLRPDADEYRYLRKTGGAAGVGSDSEGFATLRASLAAFGIRGEDEQVLLGVLGAILELGNLEFQDVDEGGIPQSELLTRGPLEHAADLLGLDPAELASCFLSKRLVAGGAVQDVPVAARQARAAQDSLARHLYGCLFSWLLAHMNACLRPQAAAAGPLSELASGACGHRCFGVLDMAGFESFQRNSLEQLLINSANECLQQVFNDCVIKTELADCHREGIVLDGLSALDCDNLDCLELMGLSTRCFCKSPGILDVLADAASLPQTADSDTKFVQKLVRQFSGQHRRFMAPRFGSDTFTVRHFAGSIEYTCNGWIEKSTDRPSEQAIELLAKSRLSFVRTLGSNMQEASAAGGGRRKAASSVVRSFRTSLSALMQKIRGLELRFVRCIKPNDQCVPGSFNAPKIVEQLRCSGILEAVRIRKSGYGFRWPLPDFERRFGCCGAAELLAAGGGSSSSSSSSSGVRRGFRREPIALPAQTLADVLCSALSIPEGELVVGRSKVLAKESAALVLEGARLRAHRDLALKVQSMFHVRQSRELLLQLRASRAPVEAGSPEPGGDRLSTPEECVAAEPPLPEEPSCPEPADLPEEAVQAAPPAPNEPEELKVAQPAKSVPAAPAAAPARVNSLRARFERAAQPGEAAESPAAQAPVVRRSAQATSLWQSLNQSSNQKVEAKKAVSEALRSGDKAALEHAVQRGASAGLDAQELREARSALAKMRQQDTAREVLAKAVEARQEPGLLNAIARGERAGLEEEELLGARQALEHLRRQSALQVIEQALQARDISRLRSALEHAETLGLGEQDLGHARRVLLETDMVIALQDARERSDLESLRAALEAAEALGIDERQLTSFKRVVRLAASPEATCAICFESGKSVRMPCCGREGTSNVVCLECASYLERCPFCRALAAL